MKKLIITTEPPIEQRTSTNVTQLTEWIEEMFNNIPDKRKKAVYLEWKNEINRLIEMVNKQAKLKLYNTC
jgi:hypothetical protein